MLNLLAKECSKSSTHLHWIKWFSIGNSGLSCYCICPFLIYLPKNWKCRHFEYVSDIWHIHNIIQIRVSCLFLSASCLLTQTPLRAISFSNIWLCLTVNLSPKSYICNLYSIISKYFSHEKCARICHIMLIFYIMHIIL